MSIKRAVLALLTLVLLVAWAAAEQRTYRLESGVTDLRDLARRVAKITGKVLIYGNEFQGRVELAPGNREMTREQVWEYFLVVLASQGWGVVTQGNAAKIVKREELVSEDQPVVMAGEGETPAPPEQMITVTVELQHMRAELVARQLEPLVGPDGRVIPVPGQNKLIIVDTEANVARLRSIIARLDAEGASETIRVVRLERANAVAMRDLLRQMMADFVIDGGMVRRRGSAQALIIAAEPGTNSLVLRGGERDVAGAALLAEKIDALDEPQAFVVRLRRAPAEDMEQILRDLLR